MLSITNFFCHQLPPYIHYTQRKYLFSKGKTFSNIQITEQTGVAVMLLTLIWEVLG
jgi:hypothetical protein